MRNTIKLGFVINPIAGMGGRVGLKGTDDVVDQALALGAVPLASVLARAMLKMFRHLRDQAAAPKPIDWLTCAGSMGADALTDAGFGKYRVIYTGNDPSNREDTINATNDFIKSGVDLIVFCGGDGTARDISSKTSDNIPMLGVPSGVKMYSGVFGSTAEQTAHILNRFINGELDIATVDVLDLDEEDYRQDRWSVRLYQKALTPFEPNLSQQAKAIISSRDEDEIKTEIADYLARTIKAHPQTLYLLGPGSTMQAIAERLHVKKTLLGIDAICAGQLVQHDINEAQILSLLERYRSHGVILSPIGAQGFVLGRGNLPLSADVIRRIGHENIQIVATPAKLASLKHLRFDTGDATLNEALANNGYRKVVIGNRRFRMVPCHRL